MMAGEFVGTYLLIFTIGCNVLTGNAVWGGVSIAMIFAVSLALALSQAAGGPGIDMKTAGPYMVVRLAAGIAASLNYSALFWDTFNWPPRRASATRTPGSTRCSTPSCSPSWC